MKLLFRISFFLLLFLSSCGTNQVVKDYNSIPIDVSTLDVPYFSNSETDYVYKANISVYGNELSGIFIAKKINETTHRVVFTTEFGNKLLDFEISEIDYKVNFILEELDKKILIKTLVNDFRLLLRHHYNVYYKFENDADIVYQAPEGDKMNYLFISKDTKKLSKIVHSSKRKAIIYVLYTAKNDFFAENIVIQHQNIKLKIALNYFKSE
ncbi:hypothetical protein [Flavobacterium adhaerens]|uniref:hypothetical protein n=1 Tax=Flavobacterium adhaerens TaxID=3149043 RepID=UPI0032B5BFED